MAMKRWVLKLTDRQDVLQISKKNGVSEVLASILDTRGFEVKDNLRVFLGDDETLPDPFEFKGMAEAVKRIKIAIDSGESVCIFGDYDADGITAVALLYSFLKERGANVSYYLPQRDGEGYGMSSRAVEKIKAKGTSLIITVDNGISAVDEIDFASSLGIDTIVTDHHRPSGDLPKTALAIVNPYQPGCESTFKDFCGAGIALLLVMAFGDSPSEKEDLLMRYIDLAAIGTIGDLVGIKLSNRFIVKLGLEQMRVSKRPGVVALLRDSNLFGKRISSQDVAFLVVPRINVCGRLASPDVALKLLLLNDVQEASRLVKDLGKQNLIRKDIENNMVKEAFELIDSDPSLKFDPVLIVASKGWHVGVIGIVASRLSSYYGKPCIVIGIDGDSAKGSGRSIDGLSLVEVVSSCSDVLNRFGGHPMAVGFDISTENIGGFRRKVNSFVRNLGSLPCLELKIDCKLEPKEANIPLATELRTLEPFGYGNPVPVFCMYNLVLTNIYPVGNAKHLRLTFLKGREVVVAMLFSVTSEEFGYQMGDAVDIAFTMHVSEFRGRDNLCVCIKDIHLRGIDVDLFIKEQRMYEEISRKIHESSEVCDLNLENKKEILEFIPSRDEFAHIYRFLRDKNFGARKTIENIHKGMGVGFAKFLLALDVFKELRIVRMKENGAAVSLKVLDLESKVNLENSEIFRKLASVKNLPKSETIA
ncbi:MAG: single-stranded-DNA-specific exonuclease RecJ [Oscillospiraceae bacterium]|nr:single-stranded-DNA-specific exonuclease RecJ [Oscillospiraceae bacterium]